jgi:hypothetical protein
MPEEGKRLSGVEIRGILARGCTEEEFNQLRCPVCGAALSLHVHPDLTQLNAYCSSPTMHVTLQESVAPQTWFKKYVGGGWW